MTISYSPSCFHFGNESKHLISFSKDSFFECCPFLPNPQLWKRLRLKAWLLQSKAGRESNWWQSLSIQPYPSGFPIPFYWRSCGTWGIVNPIKSSWRCHRCNKTFRPRYAPWKERHAGKLRSARLRTWLHHKEERTIFELNHGLFV